MSSEFDIVVAGAGIAGLTAALTAARLGRRPLVLTGDVLGGNLISIERVEGYPGFPEGVAGYELCPMVQAQAAEAGAEFESTGLQRLDGGAGKFHLVTGEGEIAARAVILAMGSQIRKLGVPGEERLAGKGVSHCASCDAPMLRGAAAAVVGGGDSAMQEALVLAQHASRVIVFHRGEALEGQQAFRERVAAEPKIEVRCGCVVEEILGDPVVSAVRVRSRTASESVEVAAVFAYAGLAPNTGFLEGRVRLDDAGRIVTDAALNAGTPGLFAAGSVRSGWAGRAVASAGEGAAVALAAERYLAEGSAPGRAA